MTWKWINKFKKNTYWMTAQGITDIKWSVDVELQAEFTILYTCLLVSISQGAVQVLDILLNRLFLLSVYGRKKVLYWYVWTNEYFYNLRASCPNWIQRNKLITIHLFIMLLQDWLQSNCRIFGFTKIVHTFPPCAPWQHHIRRHMASLSLKWVRYLSYIVDIKLVDGLVFLV